MTDRNGLPTSIADPPKPKGKIVYSFLLVLVTVGLLPLGIVAYKLIDISREALVTSQQEVQLQVAATTVRQLNAAVASLRDEMARLSEGIAALSKASGSVEGTWVRTGQRLLDRVVGSELLLVRYAPRSGPAVEASQQGLALNHETEAALRDGAEAAYNGETKVSDPLDLSGGAGRRKVLVVSVPVGPAEAPFGALSAVVDFASFWEPVVGGRRAGYTVYALDGRGGLIAAQDDEGIIKPGEYERYGVVQEFKRSRGRSALTSEFTVNVGGKPVDYLASFDTTEQGWGVFVQVDKRQAYASVSQMIQTTLVWAGLAMGLALVLAYLMAATVTRPIEVLARGTASFARGELDHRVQVSNRNELGALAATFNGMAEQIQGYIQRLSTAARINNELFMGTIKALADAIDEKDPYTRGHSERVNRYAVLLAKQMGMSKKEIREVHIASLFHDIGKIGIEDKILRKPAVLTDEEFTIMKQHPEKGAQMLSKIKAMADIIPAIRYHHERWDGTGYPMRLRGEQIPVAARVVAVADAFDAMTTHRPYQKAMTFEKAIARLFDLSDKVYDRRVVAAFAATIESGAVKEAQPVAVQEQ
jgi:putative nucleotidyltransferase with HDIG domain